MVDSEFEREVRAVMEARRERVECVRAMLRGLVMSLVGDVDAVVVEAVEAVNPRPHVLLRLQVAPADVGHVVGKKGRTARSLRTIVNVAAARQELVCVLDITQYKRVEPAAPRA